MQNSQNYWQTELKYTLKGSYAMINWDSSLECMVQHIQIKNVIHHSNRMLDWNLVIITIGAEKLFHKIKYPVMIKSL